jgi:hypothetical protein
MIKLVFLLIDSFQIKVLERDLTKITERSTIVLIKITYNNGNTV